MGDPAFEALQNLSCAVSRRACVGLFDGRSTARWAFDAASALARRYSVLDIGEAFGVGIGMFMFDADEGVPWHARHPAAAGLEECVLAVFSAQAAREASWTTRTKHDDVEQAFHDLAERGFEVFVGLHGASGKLDLHEHVPSRGASRGRIVLEDGPDLDARTKRCVSLRVVPPRHENPIAKLLALKDDLAAATTLLGKELEARLESAEKVRPVLEATRDEVVSVFGLRGVALALEWDINNLDPYESGVLCFETEPFVWQLRRVSTPTGSAK